MARLGIYVCLGRKRDQVKEYVVHYLRESRRFLDRLVVVTDIESGSPHFEQVHVLADDIVRSHSKAIRWSGEGYHVAIDALGLETIRQYSELLLFDSSAYGPLFPLEETFNVTANSDADLWSMTYFDASIDKRFGIEIVGDRVPHWNFLLLNARAIRSPAFESYWKDWVPATDHASAFIQQEVRFSQVLTGAGFKPGFVYDGPTLKTADPRFYQARELIKLRCPLVQANVFTIDPIVTDMQAIHGGRILAAIETHSDYDTGMIWHNVLLNNPLRTIYTNLEQLEIIPSVRAHPDKTSWNFGGKIAVLVHLYYADMVIELAELLQGIPSAYDLFITTASEDSRAHILAHLANFDRGRLDVRIVEQNRGRDMSSLFITFRKEMLSGEYGLALRLHSKRTPQVSHQVGEWFKDYMYYNLVPNRNFIANLFDLLESQPSIGVVIPPVIHMGFATLGHSWFNNKNRCQRVALDVGIHVPFDEHTPVAAYGTNFWFRPKALELMFEYPWKWEDYNPEPHHVDGGLAHVQERLICYAAQEKLYRVLTVMTTEMAARNYVALEYKYQLLSAQFPNGDIRHQFGYMERAKKVLRDPLGKRLRSFSRNFVTKNAGRIYKSLWRSNDEANKN